MSSNTIVVTRHAGLVEYLKEEGYIPSDAEVVAHATPEVVRGKHVWGVLPHSLSCLCRSFTEIPLNLPPELRGTELTKEQVRKYAGTPWTYEVHGRETPVGLGVLTVPAQRQLGQLGITTVEDLVQHQEAVLKNLSKKNHIDVVDFLATRGLLKAA